MRKITKDEVFEVLIVKHYERISDLDSLKILFGRDLTTEEIKYFYELIEGMRNGWVRCF